jgi:Fe-S cluster assembly ATP-binding protein
MSKTNNIFSFHNLYVEIEGKEVVKGVTLEIGRGEKHAIMGPNGSGKSSLVNALAGHPNYKIISGEASIGGKNLLEMDATDRARAGLFLAFQYPMAVPGVTVANFLRTAIKARHSGDDSVLKDFRKELTEKLELLEIDKSFVTRYLNDGFSGGEKKRIEILQMAMLKPTVALLDETDSGLDIDALRIVSNGINHAAPSDGGILLVTHYQRMLNYVKPDKVHVMMSGQIVRSGGPELALELEERGYDWLETEPIQSVGA